MSHRRSAKRQRRKLRKAQRFLNMWILTTIEGFAELGFKLGIHP